MPLLVQPARVEAPGQSADLGLLRALAVLLIFICHLFEAYGHFMAWWLNAGVQLFLVISGYLWGMRTIAGWPGWMGRRAERILPSFYFLIAVVTAANLAAGVRGLGRPLIITLLGLQDYYRVCVPGCDHLWFIPLILICYLTVPLLQALSQAAGRSRRELLAAPIFFAGLPVLYFAAYKAFSPLTYSGITNGLAFAWGYYFGNLARKGRILRDLPIYPFALACAAAVVAGRAILEIMHLAGAPHWRWFYDMFFLPWSKVAMALAVFALIQGRGRSLVNNAPVRFIDRYSYEIYLTHHVFLFGTFALAGWVDSVPGVILIVTALTVISSILLRAGVEKTQGWIFAHLRAPA